LSDVAAAPVEPEGAPVREGAKHAVGGHAADVLVLGAVALGVFGLLARAALLAVSEGSNDMRTWLEFAERISRNGVGELYDNHPFFNHPPLMGLFASAAYRLSSWSGLRFEWLFKLPMLLADLGTALLLYGRYRPASKRRAAGAFALFCCNPAAILITAYHGNTDSLCASLMLLAAVSMDGRRALGSGLALAASINVKLVPVLLIAPLLACVRDRKQAAQFLFGLALGVIPFVPYLLWHYAGFYAHALAYRSQKGIFGITFLTQQLAGLNHLGPVGKALTRFWGGAGTLVVLGWPLALAALRRLRWPQASACELGAATLLAFLVFAPGFGIQYLVYPAGLLFAVSLGSGACLGVVSGVHAFVLYASLWTGGVPYYSDFFIGQPPGALTLGLCTWILAGSILYQLMRRLRARVGPGPVRGRVAV
jgi:4-amino-4-deoxy-L-arabinose transferase-like glycosyltransferase